MAETTVVDSVESFDSALAANDESTLDDVGRGVLYDIWQDYLAEYHPEAKLICIPEWFSDKELDARRPYLLATIEHDDSSSGAVLFSETKRVDISIPENDAYAFVPIEDVLETVDISDDNEYIDESGLLWIPRKLMTIYEHA